MIAVLPRGSALFPRKTFPVIAQNLPVLQIQVPCCLAPSSGRRRPSGDVRGSSAPRRLPAGAASRNSAFDDFPPVHRLPLRGVKILGESRTLCYICSPSVRRPINGALRSAARPELKWETAGYGASLEASRSCERPRTKKVEAWRSQSPVLLL